MTSTWFPRRRRPPSFGEADRRMTLTPRDDGRVCRQSNPVIVPVANGRRRCVPFRRGVRSLAGYVRARRRDRSPLSTSHIQYSGACLVPPLEPRSASDFSVETSLESVICVSMSPRVEPGRRPPIGGSVRTVRGDAVSMAVPSRRVDRLRPFLDFAFMRAITHDDASSANRDLRGASRT